MNRLIRQVGFGLMVVGLIMVLVWAFEPLRLIWPWLRGLPLVIRIGVIAAAVGLVFLLGSLIAERARERESDRHLRDDL